MVHDTEFLKQIFGKKGANFMDRRVISLYAGQKMPTFDINTLSIS